MEHKYKVILNDGMILRAYKVEHKPGFVQVFTWDGEKRIPASNVEEVYSSKIESAYNKIVVLSSIFLAVFAFVFTLTFFF